jgi:DNA-binding NarL/FixJ family response regulator
MKRVLIFDQSFFYSKTIRLILEEKFSITDVHIANSKDDVLELISISHFDLVILDINIKELEDFDLISVVKKKCSQAKILILSYLSDYSYINNCYRLGANFFLNKNCNEEKLNQILNLLLYSNDYFTNDVNLIPTQSKPLNQFSERELFLNKLSKREFQIASMLVKGISNLEISKELCLSMSTISTYKKRILLKTETENLIELSSFYNNNLLFNNSYTIY